MVTLHQLRKYVFVSAQGTPCLWPVSQLKREGAHKQQPGAHQEKTTQHKAYANQSFPPFTQYKIEVGSSRLNLLSALWIPSCASHLVLECHVSIYFLLLEHYHGKRTLILHCHHNASSRPNSLNDVHANCLHPLNSHSLLNPLQSVAVPIAPLKLSTRSPFAGSSNVCY